MTHSRKRNEAPRINKWHTAKKRNDAFRKNQWRTEEKHHIPGNSNDATGKPVKDKNHGYWENPASKWPLVTYRAARSKIDGPTDRPTDGTHPLILILRPFCIPIPVDRGTHFCSRHALSVIYVPGWHSWHSFPHACQSVIIVVFIESNGISDGIFQFSVYFHFPPSVFFDFDGILHDSDHKNSN